MIECHVVESASREDDICGKVVGIVGGTSGARGTMRKSGDDSSDREDAIKPEKQGLIAVALKRVTTMAKGASKGNSIVPRGVAAATVAQ